MSEEKRVVEEVSAVELSYFEEHPIRVLTISLLVLLFLSYLFTINFNVLGTNYFAQTIFSISRAALFIMVSVGLTLTTRVLKFANFAHAEFLVVGVYTAIAMYRSPFFTTSCIGSFCMDNIFVVMVFAFIVTGIIAVIGEILVFGPLRKRNATPLSLMVASIGLGLIIRQLIAEIFGSTLQRAEPRYPGFFDTIGENLTGLGGIGIFLGVWFNQFTDLDLPGGVYSIRMNRTDVWGITVMVLMITALKILFTKTELGISMRATADDESLAQISGINTQRVVYWTWFIAGGVTGVGALFLLGPTNTQPASGFLQLLIIFSVVTLGGFDSFEGTLVSGFIISFIQAFTIIANEEIRAIERELGRKIVFWSTNQDWSLFGPFLVIIIVLIVRPRGIFGLIDPKAKL